MRVARGALEADLARDTARLDAALRELGDAPEASRLQAVFVTLKNTDPLEVARLGELRGCIGQVVPTYPLDLAVVKSALDAALHDPRFPEVEASELPKLSVEVTVLSPIVPMGIVEGDPDRDARDRPGEGRAPSALPAAGRRRAAVDARGDARPPRPQGGALPRGVAERRELLRLHGAGLPRGAAALT